MPNSDKSTLSPIEDDELSSSVSGEVCGKEEISIESAESLLSSISISFAESSNERSMSKIGSSAITSSVF